MRTSPGGRVWSKRYELPGGALKNVGGEARIGQGRKSSTRSLIVDAQGVKNTDGGGEKGRNGGKKVPGIKRHVAVDAQGLPRAITVATADVADRKGALLAPGCCADDLQTVQHILADGGYVGRSIARAVKGLLCAQVQIAKRGELHTFAAMPQRWMVERSFTWIEKCRGLWKSCGRKLGISQQFNPLAFRALSPRRSWAGSRSVPVLCREALAEFGQWFRSGATAAAASSA